MTSTPQRNPPPNSWQHYTLWQRVREAIYALPGYFRTTTNIAGLLATDIFTLNQVLSATIEEQAVDTLNSMRAVWDQGGQYGSYIFVRQPQTFPDVLLRSQTNGQDIILGIELKSWYVLSKEGQPSFRFKASPNACNPQDLLVVIPWALADVLSGTPRVYVPWVELAKYAAEVRNDYWQNQRASRGEDAGITLATGVQPYPVRGRFDANIQDRPNADAGGNFGRIARYGIMDVYLSQALKMPIRGIAAEEWLGFFKRF